MSGLKSTTAPGGATGCLSSMAEPFRSLQGELLKTKRAIKTQPSLLFFPSLLFACCVAGGVLAIVFTAKSAADAERQKAASLLVSVSMAWASVLQSSLYPTWVVARYVENAPNGASHCSVQSFMEKSSKDILELAPSIDDIQVAPYGVAYGLYPLISKRRNLTVLLQMGGHDLMNSSSKIANRRDAALMALKTRKFFLEGPKSLTLPNAPKNVTRGMLSRLPIFVNVTDPATGRLIADGNDTWSYEYYTEYLRRGETRQRRKSCTWLGWPAPAVLGPISSVTNCSTVIHPDTGLSYCAANATGDGTKFWGFVTAIIVWDELMEESKMATLGGANGLPYAWSLERSSETYAGVGSFSWTYVSSNKGPLVSEIDSGEAVTVTEQVFTTYWRTAVHKRGGWRPTWEKPLIVVVVVCSFVLAVMLLLLLVKAGLYADLLFSMVPRRVVSRLMRPQTVEGFGSYAESFAHVVVLFSDIVQYTNLVATLSPAETMRMLNELFADFDHLSDVNGVLKVETIGDAYMIVAGAPSPAEGVAQAKAMAHMALDMINTAHRHIAPDGTNLNIRVGIHAGPVMAGVVGTKVPRWCLFGDTVNTASRMESTSEPGRVQVSANVAELLKDISEEATSRFELAPRGRVSVKGKGDMHTWWLHEKAADEVRLTTILSQASLGGRPLPGTAHGSNGGASNGGGVYLLDESAAGEKSVPEKSAEASVGAFGKEGSRV